MELEVESRDGFHIISPSGEMVTGEGELQFKEALNRACAAGDLRVLVDFSEVPYIDSSVLGQLVHGFTIFKKAGGALKLVNPCKRIRDLLKLTRLITIFEVFETREQAMQSFRKSGDA